MGSEREVRTVGPAERGCVVAKRPELVVRWALDVGAWNLSAAQWNYLVAGLPKDEGCRVQRFLRDSDRRLALGSRLLQRALVSRVFAVAFSDVDIRRTREGKPFFLGTAERASFGLEHWNYSVSHHGRFVVIASEPICACGVDLVHVTEKNKRLAAIDGDDVETFLGYFREHCTPEEWAVINRGDNEARLEEFHRHWAMKEAFTKAIGMGLSFAVKRVSFTYTSRYVDASAATTTPSGAEGALSVSTARAVAKVDGKDRSDWTFSLAPLSASAPACEYWTCVARGPPCQWAEREFQPQGGQSGAVLGESGLLDQPDPELLAQGHAMLQPSFVFVTLDNLLPDEMWRVLENNGP